MTVVDRKITDPLWLGFACTAPLFSVSFLRINFPCFNSVFHIPFAAIFMFMIMVIGAKGLLSGSALVSPNLLIKEYGRLAIFIAAFLVWHLISVARSSDAVFGMKSFLRLLTSVICWGCIVLFLPRDHVFLRKFFTVFSWAMGLLLAYLIYIYIFVFHLTYLSSDLDFNRIFLPENRVGKNQLAYFVAKVFPFAFFIFYGARQKIVAFLPLLAMSIAVIYAVSRGTWISLTVSFVAVLVFALCNKKHFSLSGLFRRVLLFISVFIVAFLFLVLYAHISEVSSRFISIFHPSAVPQMLGRYSYESRGAVLLQAWKGFLTSPLIGVGLGNSTNYTNGLVHNDYLCVLLELGVVGSFLFFGILWEVFQKMLRHLMSFRDTDSSWSYWAIPCSWVALLLVSFFYDNYLAAYYWMFLGLYLVVIEADRTSSGETDK